MLMVNFITIFNLTEYHNIQNITALVIHAEHQNIQNITAAVIHTERGIS